MCDLEINCLYGMQFILTESREREGKEHRTSRNGISTMKYLTHEVVLPYI